MTKPSLATLVVGVWLLAFVLVLLTLFTPLEFTPLWLGNLPRWGFWALAFPAGHLLRARSGHLLWAAMPWVLWAPLFLAMGEVLWRNHQQDSAVSWKRLVYPLELTFWNDERWVRERVLFRNGARVTSLELGTNRYGSSGLHVTTAFVLLPGVQWAMHRNLTAEEIDATQLVR